MEERKTIFDYMGQILCMFGITMVCMMFFVKLFGESAKGYSTFFSLGKAGLPIEVMAEFLALSVLIVAMQYLFFSDRVIKKMSVILRTVCMVLGILACMAVFILLFGWFPVNMWQAWLLFLLCFAVSFTASMAVNVVRTRIENRKLAEGLERLKEEWKGAEKHD